MIIINYTSLGICIIQQYCHTLSVSLLLFIFAVPFYGSLECIAHLPNICALSISMLMLYILDVYCIPNCSHNDITYLNNSLFSGKVCSLSVMFANAAVV